MFIKILHHLKLLRFRLSQKPWKRRKRVPTLKLDNLKGLSYSEIHSLGICLSNLTGNINYPSPPLTITSLDEAGNESGQRRVA